MNKTFFLPLFSCFILNISHANGNQLAEGAIHRVWTEHSKYENGEKGMEIHVKFEVSGVKGRNCEVLVYFHHENESPVKDRNGRFRTSDGNVSCSRDFVPPYESTSYADFALFMPYDELHLTGHSDLKFYVAIRGNGQWLATGNYIPFSLNWNPATPASRTETPEVKTGSLTCEVDCPRKGYSCADFIISIGNREFRNSSGLSGSGIVTFNGVPEGTYNVSISFKDSKKSDNAASPPYSPLTKQVSVRRGEQSRVKF